eukprot:2372044-Amphidinium_carterae.1
MLAIIISLTCCLYGAWIQLADAVASVSIGPVSGQSCCFLPVADQHALVVLDPIASTRAIMDPILGDHLCGCVLAADDCYPECDRTEAVGTK